LLPLVLICACGAAARAGAQVVRGDVVEAGTNRPIQGVFVVLVDDQGVRRVATLTDSAGRYVLRAALAGRYSILAERVGLQSATTAAIDLAVGALAQQRIVMSIEPVRLEGIAVAGTNRCMLSAELAGRTHALWDEARKALAITVWLEREAVVFRTSVYERRRDIVTGEIEWHQGRLRSGFGRSPFHSESAQDLARHGYVRRLPGDVHQYFALDAPTLLSDAFLDTHCFHVREPEADRAEWIGLGFEPVPGRRTPDITGTLWLDRESSELRVLEFDFTEYLHPVAIPRSPFGGRVEFTHLVNGAWVVDRWWIRMPQYVTTAATLTASAHEARPVMTERDALIAAKRTGLVIGEAGGSIAFAAEPARSTDRGTARIEGVVFDSTRGRPLARATVFVSGAGQRTSTGPDGRFALAGVAAGTHTIGFLHPYADSLGLPVTLRRSEVAPGARIRTDFAVPERAGCPTVADNGSTGTLTGFAYDSRTGDPIHGARIEAAWRGRTTTVESDREGRYLICAVPLDLEIRLHARGRGRGPAVPATLQRPGIHRQDLIVR
jgi:hypothetical protein